MKLDSTEVLRTITDYYDMNINQLFKFSRKKEVVIPRHMFYHFCKKYSGLTYSEIGCIPSNYGLKKQDHSTVLYSDKKIRGWLEVDRAFKRVYEDIEGRFMDDYRKSILCPIIPNVIDLLTLCERRQDLLKAS